MHRTLRLAVFACALGALCFVIPSSYGRQAEKKPAHLHVKVPADAQVTVDGVVTKQRGELRDFVTPPLADGPNFFYIFKATWKEGGKDITREKKVRIQAGSDTTVDLRQADDTNEAKPAENKVAENKPAENKPTGDKPAENKPAENKPAGDKPSPSSTAANKAAPDDDKADRQPDVIFVPTPQEVVDKMLEMAKVQKGDVLYDLGCGDGRIVVTAAKKFQAKSTGYDIDPQRVKESIDNVKKNNVEELATIKKADIFTLDLSGANVITLYLLPDLNEKLIPQLEKLKPGSRIVSHDFPMKGAKPKDVVTIKAKDELGAEREHTIYLWEVPWEKE